MLTAKSRLLRLTMLIAGMMACSSPHAAGNSGGTDDATPADTGGKLDAVTPGDVGEDTPSDGKLTDAATDASADSEVVDSADATATDSNDAGSNCEFPKSPAAGEPGAPCTTNADCDSAVCVDGTNGKICTAVCTTCCPVGYACLPAPGVDAAFVCMPKQLALCAPCKSDAECALIDKDALCLSYGPAGQFCGAKCDQTSDCPTDHTCVDTKGQQGQGKQCVRTAGECTCTQLAVFKGASTTCSVTNTFGTCTGGRKCGNSGLSACDASTPATETCNGIDDDCDGKTDDAGSVGCVTYYKDGDGDGYGGASLGCLCSNPGGVTQGGDCNDQNAAIHPGATEICDGVDNNCNGKTDEGFPDVNTDGIADCMEPDLDGDGVINALDCSPTNAAIYPGAKEICDGLDNDCNGITDDPGAIGCTTWFADGDGDGFGGTTSECLCAATGKFTATTSSDCDDANAAIFPGATEVCNGKDDDCDGLTDAQDAKLVLPLCALQAGVCAGAKEIPARCVAGAWEACTTDDYASVATTAGVAPYNAATETLCDGADNDCDGKTDEDFTVNGPDGSAVAGVGAACGTGACAGGFTACSADKTATLCTTATATSAEVCDGIDNNCDGLTDSADSALTLTLCDNQTGVCAGALHPAKLCVGGVWQPCTTTDYVAHASSYTADSETICDGLDNDCNGKTDETFNFVSPDGSIAVGVGAACGVGACTGGKTVCAPSGKETACDSSGGSSAEVCDGIDNDCDGLTDAADPDLVTVACEVQAGVCSGSKHPAALCQNGAWQACSAADYLAQAADYQAGKELSCDGKDNDCDGSVDEDFSFTQLNGASVQGAGTACGVGACAGGVTTCNAGKNGLTCAAEGNATQEVCDGLDNDCNGKIDAADSSMQLAPCEKQLGVCTGSMHTADKCAQGAWSACAAEYGVNYEAGTSETICDGLDGNCNGTTDDIGVFPLNGNQQGACAGSKMKCNGASGFTSDYSAVPTYGQYEQPDEKFLDENCDGIDGTIAGALFVAQSGVDSGACTQSAPCKTLNYAVGKASGAASQDIYVMADSSPYAAVTIDKSAVRIFGGYDSGWVRADRNTPGHKVTLQGALDPVDQQFMVVKVRATEVQLADLVLAGVDAVGNDGVNGKSSYVVHAKDSNRLAIKRCDFLQGAGAAGLMGNSGLDASLSAAPAGGNGGNANRYSTTCDASSKGAGGTAGTNPPCPTGSAGGAGGAGGTMDSSCTAGLCAGSSCNAKAGSTGGTSAAGVLGGGGGAGTSTCGPGLAGTTATAVSNGIGGIGATSTSGSIPSDYWTGTQGGSGGLGAAGAGGGGGGGSGGCAATVAAAGGGAGGSSFGLFIANTGVANFTYVIASCTFYRGNGGSGGPGGVGGRGQSGGVGGNGGAPNNSAVGGNGGNGSHGGHGGGGGGGTGGLSVGVLAPSSASGTLTGLGFVGGAAGSGGTGGPSAPSAPVTEKDGNPGTNGADGIVETTMTCAAPGGC